MNSIRVLIVDDSAAIRKILQRVLLQTGLPIDQAFEASDGNQGLAILGENQVNVILSDVNMPNMDGIEFLRRLRRLPEYQTVPVVMITTEGSQARVQEAAELGATAYIRKPFTPDQLKDKLTALLSN